MSHGQHLKEPAAPAEAESSEPLPAPAGEPAPPPATPAPLTLEERVAKLETWIPRLEAIVGAP